MKTTKKEDLEKCKHDCIVLVEEKKTMRTWVECEECGIRLPIHRVTKEIR